MRGVQQTYCYLSLFFLTPTLMVGDGYNADEIIKLYPELEKKDIYQAVKYGAWLASEKTIAIA
ncbi:MAG: DUF433 domain-containing protein [Nitrospirota bacterium]